MALPGAEAMPTESLEAENLYTILLDSSGVRAPAIVSGRAVPVPIRHNAARGWDERLIEVDGERYWVPQEALGLRSEAEAWAAVLQQEPGRRALLPVRQAPPAAPVAPPAFPAAPSPVLRPQSVAGRGLPVGGSMFQRAAPSPVAGTTDAWPGVTDSPTACQVGPSHVRLTLHWTLSLSSCH